MPYGSLYDLLQNNQPLPWSLRYNIAMDITAGLSILHSKSILHRDLKSMNVLLDDRMRAKLTDFGLSRIKNETSSSMSTQATDKSVGTLAWMAPELVAMRPKYSKQSDMYGYGMILWELASRELPFDGVNQSVLIRKLEEGKAWEEVPEEVEDAYPSYADLIKSCWIFKAKDRPTIEEAATILENSPIEEEEAGEKDNCISSAMYLSNMS